MPVLTIRNVPDEIHRALRVRAKQHGRSMESEVRDILLIATKPEKNVRMGDALFEIGREIGLTEEDAKTLNNLQDKTPAEPIKFD